MDGSNLSFEPPFDVWDDNPHIQPRPGSWMMSPREFARGTPGLYRGYRAAGANLLKPYRTGGIYVAQNATYASTYHRPEGLDLGSKLWRVLLDIKRPVVNHVPVLNVTDEIRGSLPEGTDAIFMPMGDSNMGNGPVVVVLDSSVVVEAHETMVLSDVLEAIQMGRLSNVPEDVLADYPALQARLDIMTARWGVEFPAHRF